MFTHMDCYLVSINFFFLITPREPLKRAHWALGESYYSSLYVVYHAMQENFFFWKVPLES